MQLKTAMDAVTLSLTKGYSIRNENKPSIILRQAQDDRKIRKLLLIMTSSVARSHRTINKNIILAMKLSTLILLTTCLTAAAAGHTQGVTLSLKDAPLEKVFTEIRKQTGYNFLFSSKELKEAGKVSLHVSSASIEQVLALCFKDKPFTYTIEGNSIVVKKKEATSPNEVAVISNESEKSPPIDITGKVTDADGNPLAGASVKVKGSSLGTTTNSDGLFVLKGVDENATLEISYVGFETHTVILSGVEGKVGGGLGIIALKLKPESLNEVVINKGYYTEKQKYSVSNVAKVTAKDIEKQPVNNPLLALEGRVPGLVVTQTTGISGGGVLVRIQGQNSLTKGNDPLYVIDGVPVNSQVPTTGLSDAILGNSGSYTAGFFVVSGAGNPLSYVNPADIESIEVLKDADATAIYGSRAANGVILITTKKGKTGAAKVDVDYQQGWGKITRTMDMLNTRQYLDMRYEALRNDGIVLNSGLATSASYYDLMAWDTTRYTNWQKELIGGTAIYSNVNGNISGGTDNLQYVIGGTYHRETTVFPGGFADKKASMHFNLGGNSSNKRFRFQFSGFYLADNNQLPRTDLTNKAILLEPVAPNLYNSDGSLNWGPVVSGRSSFDVNPMADLMKTYQNKTNNLVSNAILGYQFFQGFNITTSFGYNKMQGNEFVAVPLNAVKPESRPNVLRTAQFGTKDIHSWIIEPQVNYYKQVDQSKFEILVGSTFQQYNDNGFYVEAKGFASDDVLKNISAATQIIPGFQFNSDYKYNALFGRFNYNFRKKYIVNLNWRRDGSSRFGPKKQFHNFGSVGGGWIFSEEKAVSENLPFLSFGKVRLSYGTSGNDQIGDYAFMSLYQNTYSTLPYQGASGLEPSSFSDPYMAWEQTKKLSIGIDLGFLKDRIMLNVTSARNRSSNQLLNYSLPSFTGFGAVTTNFPATVQNTSWEFSLTTVNFQKKVLSWTSYFNVTIPQNKLIAFPGIKNSSYSTIYYIGQPTTVQKVWHFLGVDPTTGKYLASDINGVPTFSPDYQNGRNILINTQPKFYGGFENSISYRNFQLDFLFQFTKQIGQNFYYYNGNRYPGQFSRGISNQPTTVLDRWQKAGDMPTVQRFSTSLQGATAVLSDADYTDASFIRLKNLSLSYRFPKNWMQRLHIRDCNLYLQGQNLWTLTNYLGMDPENQSISALPPLRVLTAGLKFGL